MLSEIRQKKTNSVCSHLHVDIEKAELLETENKMLVAKDRGAGKWGNVGQRVQTPS